MSTATDGGNISLVTMVVNTRSSGDHFGSTMALLGCKFKGYRVCGTGRQGLPSILIGNNGRRRLGVRCRRKFACMSARKSSLSGIRRMARVPSRMGTPIGGKSAINQVYCQVDKGRVKSMGLVTSAPIRGTSFKSCLGGV